MTLDSRLELAAEEAVVSVGTPATIVVIQPFMVLCWPQRQNNQAMEQGPIVFQGPIRRIQSSTW